MARYCMVISWQDLERSWQNLEKKVVEFSFYNVPSSWQEDEKIILKNEKFIKCQDFSSQNLGKIVNGSSTFGSYSTRNILFCRDVGNPKADSELQLRR